MRIKSGTSIRELSSVGTKGIQSDHAHLDDAWAEAQEWERGWWSSCQNTYGEEAKQLLYAQKMGLKAFHDGKSPFNFDMSGRSVLDIGGGPISLLLKCTNVKGVVLDPCDYPGWVYNRYRLAGIEMMRCKAEELADGVYDEVWIYNVLQHVDNPGLVIDNAKRASRIIRLFEWIDTLITPGHLHVFTEEMLNSMLGGRGKTETLKGEATCVGACYYGIFLGDHYETV